MQYKCVYMVHLKESKYAICTKKDEINDEVTWNDCLSINHLFHYWLFWRSPSENTCAFILCTDGISPNLTYIYKKKKISYRLLYNRMYDVRTVTKHMPSCLMFGIFIYRVSINVISWRVLPHRAPNKPHGACAFE